MEKTALRILLTSLCANSPWKYAVFWKLKHTHQMLLTLEDGYCDYTKQKTHFKGNPDPACSSKCSEILDFKNQPAILDTSSTDFSIGFAIGSMSRLEYMLGNGVVGRVAYTGDNNWIIFHDSVAGELSSPKTEFPEEWNLQVTAGIETVLLVPLMPHGVLQLGSFDKVVEDVSLVSEIKDKFKSVLYEDNLGQSASPDNDVCSSSLGPILDTGKDEAKMWCMKLPFEMHFEDSGVNFTDEVGNHHLSNHSDPILPSVAQNMPESFKNFQPVFLEYSCDSDQSNSSFDSRNMSDLVGQHTNANAQETIWDLLANSFMDDMDEVIHCSLLYGENDDDSERSGDSIDGIANFYLHEDVLEEPLIVSDDCYSSPTVAGTLFGLPVDRELFREIETFFPEENDHISWDLCEPHYFECVSSTRIFSSGDLVSSFDPSPWEDYGYFDEGKHEDPLQEVVPNIPEQSDVHSCTVLSPVSSLTSLGQNATASPELSQSVEAVEKLVPPAHESMSFFMGVEFCHSITLTPSTRTGSSTLTDEKKRKKRSSVPSMKGEKQTSISKKTCMDDGYKPRPRDRQLIQDRLKELRDLVPNGEKCSIDGLLDRAIKHLQFLTNVTGQAEKLRYAVDEEEDLPDGKLVDANSQQKGTNSAVEDHKLYPVTVKDLSRPGSMLIEMACNEEELFFEITKVISHLGLTILKSIMETKSGNTSAQFIVEAPRGFSKVEIFFPLMQLSQRRRNSTVPLLV